MSASTIGDDIEAFLRNGNASGWRERTVANYRHRLGILARTLRQRGCRRIADITHDDLRAVMAKAEEDDFAVSSRIQLSVIIKQLFAWLQDQGRILRNPALGLPAPDDGEQPLPDPPLSEGEVQALFAALPRRTVYDLRNACLLELLYGCALRIAEAVDLTCDDIDLSARTVRIRDGKGGQDRLLPLMTTAGAAVKDYLAVRRTLLKGPDQGALFLTKYGTAWRRLSVYGFFDRLNEVRGPDARHLYPHLFRHSIAVHLLRGKADVRYIQHFLGHSSLDTTKIYLRLVPGHLKEDYDRAMPEIAVGVSSLA